MNYISEIFNAFSSIFALITYSVYFIQVKNFQSTPNPTTWLIWLFISFFNAYTYTLISNLNQSIFLWVISFSILIIFIYTLRNKKFTKISILDYLITFIFLSSVVIYLFSRNENLTHLILQIIYIISYIPTIYLLIKNKSKEKVTAWILAFITYLFSFTALIFDNKSGLFDYLHIIVNGFIGNGTIILILITKNYRQHR